MADAKSVSRQNAGHRRGMARAAAARPECLMSRRPTDTGAAQTGRPSRPARFDFPTIPAVRPPASGASAGRDCAWTVRW